MESSTARRVLTYTALFAGGAIIGAPSGTTAVAIGASAVASLFGNTLASDIHAAVTAASFDPLSNHHLRQLAGTALAVLIECYEKEKAPTNFVERIIPIFRRPDAELSALARAARMHWDPLQLTGEPAVLKDSELYRAFSEPDRSSGEPLLSASQWKGQLAEIGILAAEHYGEGIWRDERLRLLAEVTWPPGLPTRSALWSKPISTRRWAPAVARSSRFIST